MPAFLMAFDNIKMGSGSPELLPELKVETTQAESKGVEGTGRRVRLEVGCAEAPGTQLPSRCFPGAPHFLLRRPS